MVSLTSDAQGHLERYLRRLKVALRGHQSVDVADVQRDVMGHINAELAGQPEPISASSLRDVLDRLGAPDTWVPDEDLPGWRKALNRLRSGPEEWRLAYLTLALCIAAPTLFIGGPVLWPLEPLLAIASLLTARASLTLLSEHGEPVGARRWLLYPPLLVWYVALALLLFAWPVPLLGMGLEAPSTHEHLVRFGLEPTWTTRAALFALGLGAWWTVLGLFLLQSVSTVQLVFWPFADWFERRHAKGVAVIGLILGVAAGAIVGAALIRVGGN